MERNEHSEAALSALVCRLVEELLGIPSVVPTDDFFDLGGSSLTAVQLVSRLRDLSGVTVPLVRVFDSATALNLARYI
jgi:acyl carrier protein